MSTKYAGQKFGKLTILDGFVSPTSGGNTNMKFHVRCECKAEFDVGATILTATNPMCSACRKAAHAAKSSGGYRHYLYGTWSAMLQRCYRPANVVYKNYGGRGISVCDRWRGARAGGEELGSLDGFENFKVDMGPRPYRHSIDRINNDGNYEPSNCRWATSQTQLNNHRRNVRVTLGGETMTVTQWARHFRVTSSWAIVARDHDLKLPEALRLLAQNAHKTEATWLELYGLKRKPTPKRKARFTKEELERLLAETEAEWDEILKNLPSSV